MNRWPLREGLLSGQWPWPLDRQVYLLLDGVRITHLAQRLYKGAAGCSLAADMLYAGTPLAEVSDVSPWLIALPDSDHPALRTFLEQGLEKEGGYVIESPSSLEALGSYLRRLLQVRHPSGVPLWLRIADPAVIAALLPDQSDAAMVPWGPMTCLILPDAVAGTWVTSMPAHRVADPPEVIPTDGYLINETQLARLQACNQRRDVRALLRFVTQHCPDLPLPIEKPARYERLAMLVASARDYGFTRPRHWGVLCTLFAQAGCDSWAALRQQAPNRYACLTTMEASPADKLTAAYAMTPTHPETA